MKNILLTTLLSIGVFIHTTFSQTANKELPNGYFMVVAAYAPSAQHYAVKYVKTLKDKGIDASYGFSYDKELFFVYTTHYSSRAEALQAISSERLRTGENKAWVYVHKSDHAKSQEVGTEEITSTKTDSDKTPNIKKDTVVVEEFVQTPPPVDTTQLKKDTVRITEPLRPEGSKIILIDAFEAKNSKPIAIDFNVLDLARQTHELDVTSQTPFWLVPPGSASRMIQLVSDDIGWKKQSFDFDFNNPVTDSTSNFVELKGDTTVIKFEMSQLKRGDMVTLYKVFFYKDAAIMRNKSKYELNQLLSMLENNPTQKIVIHGHTNGNAAGKVIALKDTNDTDFFNLKGEHREVNGSAKNLSYERANTVRLYLTSKGIAADRLEIKGWGGKKMIYDKHAQEARYNVRVEVEVVEE